MIYQNLEAEYNQKISASVFPAHIYTENKKKEQIRSYMKTLKTNC